MQRTLSVCDVTGSSKDVRKYRLRLERLDGIDLAREDAWHTMSDDKLDLCPRAVKRLQRFIERGITPPNVPEAAAEDAAEK